MKLTITNGSLASSVGGDKNFRKLQEAYIAMDVGLKVLSKKQSEEDLSFAEFSLLALCNQTIINNLQELPKDFSLAAKYPGFFNFIFIEDGLFGREDRIITTHSKNFFNIYRDNHSHMSSSFFSQWEMASKELRSLLESERRLPSFSYNGDLEHSILSGQDFDAERADLQKLQNPLLRKNIMLDCVSQIMFCKRIFDSGSSDTLEFRAMFVLLQQAIYESLAHYSRSSTVEEAKLFSETNLGMLTKQPEFRSIRNEFAHSQGMQGLESLMSQLLNYELQDENISKILNARKSSSEKSSSKSKVKHTTLHYFQEKEDSNEKEQKGALKQKGQQKSQKHLAHKSAKSKDLEENKLLEQFIAENKKIKEQMEKSLFFSLKDMRDISAALLELSLRCYLEAIKSECEISSSRANQLKIKELLTKLKEYKIEFSILKGQNNLKSLSEEQWQDFVDEIAVHEAFDPKSSCVVLEKSCSLHEIAKMSLYEIKPVRISDSILVKKITKSGFDISNYCSVEKKFEIIKKFFDKGIDGFSLCKLIGNLHLNNLPELVNSVVEYICDIDQDIMNLVLDHLRSEIKGFERISQDIKMLCGLKDTQKSFEILRDLIEDKMGYGSQKIEGFALAEQVTSSAIVFANVLQPSSEEVGDIFLDSTNAAYMKVIGLVPKVLDVDGVQ